jgi:hypothetical protein
MDPGEWLPPVPPDDGDAQPDTSETFGRFRYTEEQKKLRDFWHQYYKELSSWIDIWWEIGMGRRKCTPEEVTALNIILGELGSLLKRLSEKKPKMEGEKNDDRVPGHFLSPGETQPHTPPHQPRTPDCTEERLRLFEFRDKYQEELSSWINIWKKIGDGRRRCTPEEVTALNTILGELESLLDRLSEKRPKMEGEKN